MNFLDMRTILFNLAITNLICAMVMSALWIQNRKHTPAMGFWFADYVLQVLSIPLIFLRGVLPFFISAVVGNFLVMTGTLLLYIGLERFVGRPSRQTHNYILLGLFALTHTWFTLVQPDMQARNINFSIILLLFSAQIAWLMLRRVAPEWRPATRPIGWLYLIYGLVSLSRVFVDLTYPPSNDLFKSGTYDTLVILIYQMLFIGLTFSLTLMSNRRLVMDLEIDDLERNHAERLLKQSQEKFALAFQNSPDTLIITRLVDGKIIEVNQGFHDMSGYTAAEIAGKTTFDLQLWDSIADRTRVVDLLKSDGKVVNFETRFRRKSGAVFTGLVSAEIVQLPEGLCSLTVIHDISSRKQAEVALRETRDYLENLIGYANAPIITWDPDYVITRFNRAFERMTGYTAAEIVGQRLEFLFPAQDREASLEKIARATGGEFLESVEIPIQRKDGMVRIALWNSANIYTADGVTLTATIAQGQDITERKQAEGALRETRDYLENLIGYANAPIITWDPDYVITRFNRAFERMTGYTAAEVVGQRLELLFPTQDREASLEKIARATGGEFLESVEIPIQRKDGVVRIALWNSANIYAADGVTLTATIAQGQDITERKQVEGALRETRDYLENLIGYANAPIITWDPDYVITRFNRAFERMTGYTAAEVVGQRLELLFPTQDREASLEKIARATGGEFLESVEIPIQRKDGVVRIALWNSANIYAADGVTLTATIAQGQDITERKQQEEDIRASQMEMRRLLDLADQSRLALLSMVEDQKAAQEQIQTLNAGLEQRVVERTSQLQVANKELEAFAYSVSHDLRAPLRGIDGWSLALLEDYSSKLDDSGKEYLHRVRSETQRMGQLIDDLLRLSRVSRVEMVRSEVNLSDLVESITKRIQKEQPDRAFDFVIQPGLKSQGDFHLLEIALSNLLENAAKFTGPQQHPRIEFGKMAANGKNPYFIRDNGVGFDMAYRDKLFGAFQRLHRYAEFPGTGIGLATVARIILRHGGSVWAEAQVNQGAVFYFTLGEDKPS